MRSILLIELDTDHNNPFVKVYKKKWIKDNLLKVKSKEQTTKGDPGVLAFPEAGRTFYSHTSRAFILCIDFFFLS